jgi:hypothetical protein
MLNWVLNRNAEGAARDGESGSFLEKTRRNSSS